MNRFFELLTVSLLSVLIFSEISNQHLINRIRRSAPERREPKMQMRNAPWRDRNNERFIL